MTDNRSISGKKHFTIIKYLVRWTLLVTPVAVAIGSMVAFFLWLLSAAIHFRFQHYWLLFLLPAAGLLIHFIYQSVGKSSEKGNILIIEQIQEGDGGVPTVMAPLILITTVITHLFGGSAGREGTAVQIGGSIASAFGKGFKLKEPDIRILLITGVAAGFGAVFGTPAAGAIFAIEVLTIGAIKYEALIPAFIAAVIGSITVDAWRVKHTHYHIDALTDLPYFLPNLFPLDVLLLGKVVIASAAFGLASYLFTGMAHKIKNIFLRLFRWKWLIPVSGGLIIIGINLLIGKPDYLGLGVDAEYPGAITIPSAFTAGGSDTWSWLWKTAYTTITLGSGFKGGEVTPLFYIGATLGNTLSGLLNAPVSLFAALGLIAVFAGATNTPLASTIMGIELFGGEHTLLFALACFTAYVFSGYSSIYNAQPIAVSKAGDPYLGGEMLDEKAAKQKGYLYQKFRKYRLPARKTREDKKRVE